MQHHVRVHRALHDGLVKRAVVAVAMQLDRDFAIIALQGFKLSIHAAQLVGTPVLSHDGLDIGGPGGSTRRNFTPGPPPHGAVPALTSRGDPGYLSTPRRPSRSRVA